MRDYTKIEASRRGVGNGQRAKREDGMSREERGEMSREQRAEQKPISGTRPHWRFEDLQIWNSACDLAVDFHRIAGQLDARRLYRYAEQLRAAGLSLPNNIAGSAP